MEIHLCGLRIHVDICIVLVVVLVVVLVASLRSMASDLSE